MLKYYVDVNLDLILCDKKNNYYLYKINKMKKISIIIPFYNEKENLPIILSKVKTLIDNEATYKFEILLMDNDSIDGSDLIANELMKNFDDIKYFKMSRNFGYQANIKAGYDYCLGDAAVQLDADGEDDPEIISKFIIEWENGNDVVYGIREKREESFLLSFFRNIFYKFLNKFSDVNLPIGAGDFRLIDRKVIDSLIKLDEKNLYLRGLISYIGFQQKGITYNRNKRFSGTSKISLIKYFEISITAITSFTKTPLLIIFLIGLALSSISLILLIMYLFIFLFSDIPQPGFTTLVLLQLSFFGLIILLIGIVLIYVGYILDEVKKRPTYIIDVKNKK